MWKKAGKQVKTTQDIGDNIDMCDYQELLEKSWILYHVMDRFIGGRELVALKRKLVISSEYYDNLDSITPRFHTGSRAEGIDMAGSDKDMMIVDIDTVVSSPQQVSNNPPDIRNKTMTIMTESDSNPADSRPGYVNLQVAHLGQRVDGYMFNAIVPVEDAQFLSSEMYNHLKNDIISKEQFITHINGPAITMTGQDNNTDCDSDTVYSLPCYNWPNTADEWVNRPRLHGWPNKRLKDQIVRGGCHLVPVGDKTSGDSFLPWRISFVSAERKLICSLTYVQFLTYGLLKYFLKQISGMLKQLLGEPEILSSYIMKTVVFHAVEITPDFFWQEKHIFLCFMFCINVLISWVRAGYCPNYFINRNNMFFGKVYGENQQKLLRFLIDFHDLKWGCLSVGTYIQPSVGERVNRVQNGAWDVVLPPATQLEKECDMEIFRNALCFRNSHAVLPASLTLLSKSRSDEDEFIHYASVVRALSYLGMGQFKGHTAVSGNKTRYQILKKCKKFLTPLASLCDSPGLLMLATYNYQTGNYTKTLQQCLDLISSFKVFFGQGKIRLDDRYENLYCGHGYSLQKKCKEMFVSGVKITENASQFFPTQLQLEVEEGAGRLFVPPLPYAAFLSFLCFHELYDTSGCDATLCYLNDLKYDENQGVGLYWVVHNLLGICYEMVGDIPRALGEYRDSLGVAIYSQKINPAKKRMERLEKR
ncbi:uncharacterized protein LOC132555148 [Ylistrum balloti]|uniref:uncharacterized protein LOC132555148 n=1 Tax=Ylistrum balloti TaxID=509963 RepID=UPI002905E699|nr:uncharacterized protein LOC132555148 [Ylistrum balloti]